MRIRNVAIALLATMAPFTFAADKDVEALLKQLRENYQKVKSVRFEILATRPDTGGDDNPLNSVVEYRAPMSFRIVTTAKSMPAGKNLTVISDGKRLYTKPPAGEVTTKALNLDDAGAFINLEGLCFWDYKRQLSTAKGANMNESQLRLLKHETWKGADFMVLEEKAPKSNVFVRYYIDPKTKFIMRTAVYGLEDTAQVVGDYRITKIDMKAVVPASAVKIPGT